MPSPKPAGVASTPKPHWAGRAGFLFRCRSAFAGGIQAIKQLPGQPFLPVIGSYSQISELFFVGLEVITRQLFALGARFCLHTFGAKNDFRWMMGLQAFVKNYKVRKNASLANRVLSP